MEQGAGARWVRTALLIVAAVALTARYSWSQFHGVPTEWTLQQAELGRQVARGQGFTTLVNYPQTYAVMKDRGVLLSEKTLYPELHHAPLYALLLAAVFKIAPEAMWKHIPESPNGWAPDYVVLGYARQQGLAISTFYAMKLRLSVLASSGASPQRPLFQAVALIEEQSPASGSLTLSFD